MKINTTLLLVCLAAILPAQTPLTQTLPRGFDSLTGTIVTTWGFGYSPGTSTSQRLQSVVDSEEFAHQGPQLIQEMWVRVMLPQPGTTLPSIDVDLAASALDWYDPDPLFAINAPSPALVRSGPLTIPATTAPTWVPLGLTQSFPYDPTTGQDLVIDLRRCGGTASVAVDSVHNGAGISVQDPLFPVTTRTDFNSCTATAGSSRWRNQGLLYRIQTLPLCWTAPQWQPNQLAASLRSGNRQGDACQPVRLAVPAGRSFPLTLASTALSAPFDLGITLAPGVPAHAGAPVTPLGQLANVDLSASDFTLLFQGSWSQQIPGGSLTVPLVAAIDVSAQMIALDPGHPEGFGLSALNRIEIAPCPTPLPLPAPVTGLSQNGDPFPVACLGPLAPLDLTLFGVAHDIITISRRGEVVFGGQTSSARGTPRHAILDRPWVGFRGVNPDLSLGGTITVTTPAPNLVVVDYVNVSVLIPGYCALPGPFGGCWQWVPPGATLPASFSIGFDAVTGVVILQGVSAFAAGGALAGQEVMIGLGAGRGITFDPGATAYSIGGPNPGPGPAAMLWSPIGAALPPGLNLLVFTPTGNGGYTWSGF